MKNLLPFALSAALGLTLFTGCGEGTPTVSAANQKAFESAPAEVKQAWQTALAASQTNCYAVVVSTLRGLTAKQLSLEQVEAVQNAMRAINVKLTAAVERGDPAAVKAMEEIKAAAGRGR